MSMSITTTIVSFRSPIPSIIVVTTNTNNGDASTQAGLRAIYIAGIVIGTIAIVLSMLSLLICFYCFRLQRKRGYSNHSRRWWPVTSGERPTTSSASTIKVEQETLDDSKTETSTLIQAARGSKSWWPKYYRISPPPHMQLLPLRRSTAMKQGDVAAVEKRLKPSTKSVRTSKSNLINLISSPLQQHPINIPAAGHDNKGKARLDSARPNTPLRSPLRAASPMSNIYAGNLPSASDADSGHDVSGYPVVISQDSTGLGHKPSESQHHQAHSRSNRRVHKSRSSHRSTSRHTATSATSQQTGSSKSSPSPTKLPVVPAPPIPSPRHASPKAHKISPQKERRRTSQRQTHSRCESATDIDLSGDEQVIHRQHVESNVMHSLSTPTHTHMPGQGQNRSPTISIKYPSVPKASNVRASNVMGSPHISTVSLSGHSSAHSTMAHDRSASSTPVHATKSIAGSRGSIHNSSQGTTPTNPRTPVITSKYHDISARTPTPFTPVPRNATVASPATISGTSSLRDEDFWQYAPARQAGTWPRNGKKSRSHSRSRRNQDTSGPSQANKVVRNDLPQSDVYDFF